MFHSGSSEASEVLPDITSDEDSNLFGRPVTESATAWDGGDTDNPSEVHVKCCKRPVTESVTARASDTEEPLVMKVSSVTMELSELRTSVCGRIRTGAVASGAEQYAGMPVPNDIVRGP